MVFVICAVYVGLGRGTSEVLVRTELNARTLAGVVAHLCCFPFLHCACSGVIEKPETMRSLYGFTDTRNGLHGAGECYKLGRHLLPTSSCML